MPEVRPRSWSGKLRALGAYLSARILPSSPVYLRAALSIKGHLSLDEVTLLHRLATEAIGGCIVEIGSYRGRSTMALALGSRAGGNPPVFAIEPHEPFRGILGGTFGPADRAAFLRNMRRHRAWEVVRLVNLPAAQVAVGWSLPIALLWIDGDHRYESVREDFHAWLPHVGSGGVIAMHDTIPAEEGPGRVVSEALAAALVERTEQVGLTCVLRKR